MLIIATLIAAIVTESGIMLAADTATIDPQTNVPYASVTKKIEQTGARSGAAINGNTRWIGEMSADFGAVLSRVASDLRRLQTASLSEQADRIAEAIRGEAESNAKPEIVKLLEYRSGKVLTVTVAGFDGAQARIYLRTIAIDPGSVDGPRIRFVVERQELAPTECLVFLGSPAVAMALVGGGDARTLPIALRINSSVQHMRMTWVSNCRASVSATDAESFFRLAVQATNEYGASFGIVPGSVSVPVDILTIPAVGEAQMVRFPASK